MTNPAIEKPNGFQALQIHGEIAAFAALLKEQKVRSYLEIGSLFGGSAWYIGSNLPNGLRMVLIDLPRGNPDWKDSEPSLIRCAESLRKCGHDVDIVWGDSTDPVVVKKVRDQGPFDACFIDGNHTRAYLEQDWNNYGSISRIVAFHDISWRRDKGVMGIDVPQFWNVLKNSHFHVELKMDPKSKDFGIGVLWRY